MKNSTKKLIYSALIAALYAACSLLPGINAISYGPVQLRISEALMLLCVLSPSAVSGVTIGCFIANLFSPFGANVFDLLLGTGATLIAASITYKMRNTFLRYPMLSPVPTILSNALIVGTYLPYLSGALSAVSVFYCILTIGLGEAAVCYILALPLMQAVKKKNLIS